MAPTLHRTAAALLAACVVAFAGGARAQEITLKVHHFLPPTTTGQVAVIQPWCDRIARESGGRLACRIYPMMQLGGTPPQLYDQAKDGIADVVWTLPGYTAGRFPASEAFELPFLMKSPEGASRALWTYARQNRLFETEYRDVNVLALWVNDAGYLHTTSRPVRTLADFKGMKLRAPTRLTTRLLSALGASPVAMPVTAVPDSLGKGVIDGALLPWEVIPAIKVEELVRFHTETDPSSRAIYTNVFLLAMNRAAYERLPADLRRVIDAASGEELSAAAGRVWQNSRGPARKLATDRGNAIHVVPAAELANWERAAASVDDDWVKEVGARGLDGRSLLDSARGLLRRYDP